MKRFLAIFLCLCTLMAAFPLSTAFAAEGDDEDVYGDASFDAENAEQLAGEYVLDEILIKFKEPWEVPGKEKQLEKEIAKLEKIGFVEGLGVYLIKESELTRNPNAILNRYKNNKYIEYVEPNYILKTESAPTDPNYKLQSAMLTAQNSLAGWDITTGEGSPIVAIVDSGVASHPDLPGMYSGYSAVSSLKYANDTVGHGTQVAGVIGAVANNGIGGVGINWNAKLMAVKADDASGVLSVANVAKCVIWAADNGAKIINLSLSTTSSSTTLKNAIDYAFNKGCAIFAATGNNGSSTINYPAAYSNVMAVGMSANGTTRAAASNYGTGMGVVAVSPYYSTTVSGGYANSSGTSFASPQVAALASLIWSVAPSISNTQVYSLIEQNAKPLGGGYNTQTGYGLIDIGKTLKAAQELGGGGKTETKDTVAPVITLIGDATITLNEGDIYEEPGYTASDDVDGDVTHLVKIVGNVNTSFAGTYTLTYTVLDKAGSMATATRTIVVNPVDLPKSAQPIIAQVGSNPIILHLGGSPYIEQGATAYCDTDGDLTSKIVTTSNVDTSRAGNYQVTYTVTNSAGLTASVTREVRVLAPKDQMAPRTPYSFTVNGKVGGTSINSITADSAGTATISVTVPNKTSGQVIIRSTSGVEVFNQTFAGGSTQNVWLEMGNYTVTGVIAAGNGNTNFTMNLLMPETMYLTFAEPEVPFGKLTSENIVVIAAVAMLLLGAAVVFAYRINKKKRAAPK